MTGNPFAPKMTETQREEAMRRYGRGESLNRIAKDYRIGSAALTKTLKKRGLVLREKKFRQKHISPDLERKIITDYAAGKAVARIAAEHGVSTGIAGRTIKDSGAHKPAQIRRSTGWTKRRFKEELGRLAEKLGRIPTTSDWYKSGLPSAISFTHKWKKPWNALVEESGLTPRVKYGWTRERLKREFLKLLRQGKVLPLRESFNQCEQLPSTAVARDLYGSFKAFVHECGIEGITKQSLCYQWEYCCEQIAQRLYGNIVVQSLDTHVHGRPDVVVPERKLIIDAMTTAYMVPHKLSEIRRYHKGYELEFWCLFRIGKEHPGICYRYADELLKTKGIPSSVKKIGRELMRAYRSPAYRQELLDILSRYYADTGKIPMYAQLHEIGAPTGRIYYREFGKFEKVLELAGIPQRPPHLRHTEEELVQYLRAVYQEKQRPLSPKDLRRTGISIRTIASRLGSFDKGCKQAGVPCKRLVVTKRLSDDDILEVLRGVSARTGEPISSSGIRKSGEIKRDTVVKRFGSLERGCELADVPYAQLKGAEKFTDEDLKKRLRTLNRRLGRPLTSIDIKGEPQSKWWRFVQRYETREHACEVAGVPFRRLAKRRRQPKKGTER